MIHTIYRDDEVIVAFNGFPYSIDVDDPRYEDVCDAVRDDDEGALEALLSIKQRADAMFTDLSEDGIEQSAGYYTYKGNPIGMDLTDYLRSALDTGEHGPIVQFIQRLFKNPSQDTRERLFAFMEKNKMPIDKNGMFLAFKGVSSDYYDKRTGTVYNGPGTTVPMLEWDEVDTDPSNTCSRGYHACSKEYLTGWVYDDDRVVSVALDPAEVASIPDDYNGSKLRCRQYTVLADVTEQYTREQEDVTLHSAGGLNPNAPADVGVMSMNRMYY